MYDDLFTVSPEAGSDSFHQTVTFAEAISRPATIDVFGIETEWAVIPVLTPTYRRSNECLAFSTFEFLCLCDSDGRRIFTA
jgi:hypothetical protein